MKILITGGAGFVGSNLAILLKNSNPDYDIICLDNLKRRGSELSLIRLKKSGISFVHGDIRKKDDLIGLPKNDLIIECSAEPSVMAGMDGRVDYLIETNLLGTINCLELAKRDSSDFIFLSTSRVYPLELINQIAYEETASRYILSKNQAIEGVNENGLSENFPLKGSRTLYGSSKLASELFVEEYRSLFGIKTVINRCGVITGPWQMGKVDQGIVTHWVVSHLLGKELAYFGYGGMGKQVRDILHIKDFFNLIKYQIENISSVNGELFNVGGGNDVSISLNELTNICRKVTKVNIPINCVTEDRAGDIRIYVTDNSKVLSKTGWTPKISAEEIVEDIAYWFLKNKKELEMIF